MKVNQFLTALQGLRASIEYVDARGSLQAHIPLDHADSQELTLRVERFRGSTTEEPLFVAVTNVHLKGTKRNPKLDSYMFSGHSVSLERIFLTLEDELRGAACAEQCPRRALARAA